MTFGRQYYQFYQPVDFLDFIFLMILTIFEILEGRLGWKVWKGSFKLCVLPGYLDLLKVQMGVPFRICECGTDKVVIRAISATISIPSVILASNQGRTCRGG